MVNRIKFVKPVQNIPRFSRWTLRKPAPFKGGLATGAFFLMFLVAIGLLFSNALAQNKKAFSELEALALSNSQNFAQQLQQKIEADKRLSTARRDRLPQFSANYRYITDGLSLADDFLDTRSSLSLRLRQDLVELFKIRPAAIAQARAESDFAKIQLKLAQQYILQEFRTAYTDALTLKAEAGFYKKLDSIYAKLLKIKSEQYNYSETLLPQVLEVETKKLQTQNQLDYSRRRFKNKKSGIAAFLNIDEDLILWDEPDLEIPALELSDLIRQARKSDLEFFKQKYRSIAAGGRAHQAAYEDLKFELFAGVRYRGDEWSPQTYSPEIGAWLSFPIFYPWHRSAKKDRFTARGKAYSEAAHTSASQTEAEVRAHYDDLIFLKSQQALAKKQIELRREKLRIEASNGRSRKDDENILRLEADLTEAHLKAKIATYKHLQAYYKLLTISGVSSTQKILSNKKRLGNNFHKALWVWQAEKIVFNQNKRTDFAKFCEANDITQIYLSLNKKIIAHENFERAVGNLIAQLHEQGVKVSALIGDPHWIFPKKQKNMQAKIKTIAEYNQQAARDKKFDAIHFDVEPQALKSWSTESKPALMNALSMTLAAAKSMMDEYQLSIPMECDIPYFFYKIDSQALEEMIGLADETVIMAYQTTNVEKLKNSVLPILELGQKHEKKVTIGIDPSDFSDTKEMREFSQSLRQEFEILTYFKGMAYHDYENYKRLQGK